MCGITANFKFKKQASTRQFYAYFIDEDIEALRSQIFFPKCLNLDSNLALWDPKFLPCLCVNTICRNPDTVCSTFPLKQPVYPSKSARMWMLMPVYTVGRPGLATSMTCPGFMSSRPRKLTARLLPRRSTHRVHKGTSSRGNLHTGEGLGDRVSTQGTYLYSRPQGTQR